LKRGRFFVGTSGWSYNHWRGLFYPADMPPRRWFTHYARYFSTVEINYTFYRLPAEKTFLRWREQDPRWFVYALKAPRTITHLRKLRECMEVVDRFLDRARLLGSKLGPIVYARMHGVGVKYSGSCDKEQLQEVAGWAADYLNQGYDTLVYFNNDAQAHAVQNAWELGRLVENLLGGDDAQRS